MEERYVHPAIEYDYASEAGTGEEMSWWECLILIALLLGGWCVWEIIYAKEAVWRLFSRQKKGGGT